MALAAEVLYEWREAERTLRLLPDDSPQRPTVEAAVEEMRALYHRVTEKAPETANAIGNARARIEETRALLRAIRSKG
jgi:hypothetical protein